MTKPLRLALRLSSRSRRCAALGLTLAIAACGGGNEPEPAEPEAQDVEATTTEAPPAPTAGTTGSGPSPSTIMIKLKEQNGSGQTGTATLHEREDVTFDVVIEMSPPAKFPGDSQNAHIHNVTCAEYAGMTGFNERLATVVDWLSNLAKGRSRTTVEQPLVERATGTFSINVHEQASPYTVVACGDIPER
jgi:hypothetical protein